MSVGHGNIMQGFTCDVATGGPFGTPVKIFTICKKY
jgi:hypothetical protein